MLSTEEDAEPGGYGDGDRTSARGPPPAAAG
jgi:hypothetical protein